MARTKKVITEETILDEGNEGTSQESIEFKLKTGHTRVFSLEEHGENFMDIAEEFKTTNIDKIIV